MAKTKLIPIKLGLEEYLENPERYTKDARVGLVCNQATVNHNFAHAADLLFQNEKINLNALFGPQHGVRGDVQDNMIETAHKVDKKIGIPVYSLYSETREPTAEMLADLDILLFDLQDVGCRVYTFIYTMANCMIACKKYGKKIIILDRPNPINGIDVEGNLLEKGNESFVGMYPIPMRHGMTIGELATMFNHEFDINCDLEIVKTDGWQRPLFADETDLPWVMPSPNMPTVDTATVFPGTVYFEGTELSEGRGTTRPFEIVGANFIDAENYAQALNNLKLPGVIFRAVEFIPTFQKLSGKLCGGVFLHVIDRKIFKPVKTGILLLKTAYEIYPNEFKWKTTPYEYEFNRNPFDVIHGASDIRKDIEGREDISKHFDRWDKEISDFEKLRNKYLMY